MLLAVFRCCGGALPLSYDELKQSVTLLKLNTAVSQDLSTSLAMAIVDRLAERGKALKRVVVAAAVQPPKRNQVKKREEPQHVSAMDVKNCRTEGFFCCVSLPYLVNLVMLYSPRCCREKNVKLPSGDHSVPDSAVTESYYLCSTYLADDGIL